MVNELSSRPGIVIYAGVRALPLAADSALAKLASSLPQVVIPIKITSADEEDNAAAADEVRARVEHVDVVIANAGESFPSASRSPHNAWTDIPGVLSGVGPIAKLDIESVRSQLVVNTVGPLVLFKAFAPLLAAAAPGQAKFVTITSSAGQISEQLPMPIASYGASKAAANYIAKNINWEYPDVISFPMQ
jgi:NAD(P)-dependent dehydrogenase (short-subunit alcohol dehydrogenase family)